MVFKLISDRSDRRCDISDRRKAFLLKNHAKLTYFHLIFPSFQYYAALSRTWNPIYVEYISDVINKAGALPTNKLCSKREAITLSKWLVCASNDAKYMIKISNFHYKQ